MFVGFFCRCHLRLHLPFLSCTIQTVFGHALPVYDCVHPAGKKCLKRFGGTESVQARRSRAQHPGVVTSTRDASQWSGAQAERKTLSNANLLNGLKQLLARGTSQCCSVDLDFSGRLIRFRLSSINTESKKKRQQTKTVPEWLQLAFGIADQTHTRLEHQLLAASDCC